MPNAWNHPSLIASEALGQMTDALTWGRQTTRDVTPQFANQSMKIGDTVNLRSTPDYEAKEFTSVGPIVRQAIRDAVLPFKIEKLFDVSVDITAKEKALDLDSFTTQVIAPAAYRLAEKVDAYIAGKVLAGAAGLYASADLMGNVGDLALARAAANYQRLDPRNRFSMLSPDLEAKALGKDYFYQASIRGDGANLEALREGFLAKTMGFNFFGTQYFPATALDAGNLAGATDNTGGANLVGSSVLKVQSVTGTIGTGRTNIAVAGYRTPLVVIDVIDSTHLELLYPIMEIIPDDAAFTTVGSGEELTGQGLLLDSRAVGLAMPSLGTPSDKPSFSISNNGYSIRVVQGYDMDAKQEILSMDCLVGAGLIDPRRATILAQIDP
jgi:hypothetical protein